MRVSLPCSISLCLRRPPKKPDGTRIRSELGWNVIPYEKSTRHMADASFLTGSFLSSQDVSIQVLSAFECLTTVFGMGTGGSTQLSSPDMLLKDCNGSLLAFAHNVWSYKDQLRSATFHWNIALSKLYRRRNVEHFGITHKQACGSLLKSSPRPISIGPLHALLHFHSRPIYLVVYKGSYQIALWETSS